ncbi:MAG: DUF3592 domain-containing protein [Candidatus Hydrogenedentes bacterium]|nr:DUF3592 domain-containing protein [Candidatus Hydrogenedentota bacterium]
MSLRKRHRWRKPGIAEVLFVLAVVVAMLPISYWWLRLNRPVWNNAPGSILSGKILSTHYNAERYDPKVRAQYQYLVGTVTFQGTFEGFWPEVGSPNALPPDRLEEITKPGHPLVVAYDPANPQRSVLHPLLEESQLKYFLLSVAGLLVGGAYCLIIYPAWRNH